MTAATEPVGVSQVFPRPPIESLFKDRYFVSGCGIGSGRDITKWFNVPVERLFCCLHNKSSKTNIILKSLPIVKIPTSRTTNKPTNFTDMEPKSY